MKGLLSPTNVKMPWFKQTDIAQALQDVITLENWPRLQDRIGNAQHLPQSEAGLICGETTVTVRPLISKLDML